MTERSDRLHLDFSEPAAAHPHRHRLSNPTLLCGRSLCPLDGGGGSGGDADLEAERHLQLGCPAECHQAPHSTGEVQGGEKDTDTQVSG